MKHEVLTRAIGELDDELIADAYAYKPRKRYALPRFLAAAACLVLVLAAALAMTRDTLPAEIKVEGAALSSIPIPISQPAAMTLSLAACGSKTDDNSGNNSQPASALELLNAVWANYSDDDKFPAAGGDFDEANMTEDAPGNFSVEDGDALDYSLSFPAADAGKLSDAASLTHMMNANTFTAGAFHIANAPDVDAVVSDLKDNIINRQWMCGFPDKLVILTLGDYVISCYGAEDLVDQFSGKVTETFADAAVVCDEAIA